MITVANIAAFMERFAPLRLAAEWDNVGLLLGDNDAPVQGVMTCLTVTPESADEAIADGAHLIVAHHPILFRGEKRLTSSTPEGRMIYRLARAGIAVYSPHTAFDNTAGGINDILARRLKLTQVRPLQALDEPRHCKIAVFVPEADLARVSDALFAAGAGVIGQYSQCSYRLSGVGTFFGSDAANPTVGQKGRREEVNEWRLEVLCPEEKVNDAVRAVRQAHSYEEPAFDVVALRPDPGKLGIGRMGELPSDMPLADFARIVSQSLKTAGTHVVGDRDRMVRRVAIVCGAGGELIGRAVGKADVLLTGEARFHDCLAAQSRGLALVLPGHYATERCGVEELAQLLAAQFPDAKVWASKREQDVARWI